MSLKSKLPWRRRQEQVGKDKPTKTWWSKFWASRSAWTLVGGAFAFVVTQGGQNLINLRKLPSEAMQTYHSFQTWYYDE